MKPAKTHKPIQYTAKEVHEDEGIASTAVMRFRTARPYVLLAHLYVLTKSPGSDAQPKDCASLSDLLMFASTMVMGHDFRRAAMAAMHEAKVHKLVTAVASNDAQGETLYRLTEEGICFLMTGHKRRLALQNRKHKWLPEDVCRHCAEDEIEEWLDLVSEERTRNAFDSLVSPTKFVETLIQGVRERIMYRSASVTTMWAGLVMR